MKPTFQLVAPGSCLGNPSSEHHQVYGGNRKSQAAARNPLERMKGNKKHARIMVLQRKKYEKSRALAREGGGARDGAQGEMKLEKQQVSLLAEKTKLKKKRNRENNQKAQTRQARTVGVCQKDSKKKGKMISEDQGRKKKSLARRKNQDKKKEKKEKKKKKPKQTKKKKKKQKKKKKKKTKRKREQKKKKKKKKNQKKTQTKKQNPRDDQGKGRCLFSLDVLFTVPTGNCAPGSTTGEGQEPGEFDEKEAAQGTSGGRKKTLLKRGER